MRLCLIGSAIGKESEGYDATINSRDVSSIGLKRANNLLVLHEKERREEKQGAIPLLSLLS